MNQADQFGPPGVQLPGATRHANQILPQEDQQPGPPSPPPGLEEIRSQMYPTQTTDDFAIYSPPTTNGPQNGPGQLRFQVKEPIQADAIVKDKRNPNIKYRPNDGPMGFGYYKESNDHPNVINFYPVTGLGQYIQSHQHAPNHQRQHTKPKPPPFPYPPPPRPPTSPPPDLIDPNWFTWWKDTQKIDPSKHPDWLRRNMVEDRVEPMLDYIKRIQGPQAEKYKEALLQKAKELSPDKPEPPKDEKWFAEQRGMLGREEYMKPVSYLDGVTDWRKDPFFEQRDKEAK